MVEERECGSPNGASARNRCRYASVALVDGIGASSRYAKQGPYQALIASRLNLFNRVSTYAHPAWRAFVRIRRVSIANNFANPLVRESCLLCSSRRFLALLGLPDCAGQMFTFGRLRCRCRQIRRGRRRRHHRVAAALAGFRLELENRFSKLVRLHSARRRWREQNLRKR
jgi:hypothetical protein